MEYTSTRDAALRATAAEAIVTGLAPDGGLFVPVGLPQMDFKALLGHSYTQVAAAILGALLPEWDPAALGADIEASYGAPFGGKAGHLVPLRDKLYALELWHGPTFAFKDYALQLMPRLLTRAKAITGDTGKTLVLVATSGDTGKAALEGFKDVAGTAICVFYPADGTSRIQQLQMDTQEGGNLAVYAVQGNFDDTQRGVKRAFGSRELAAALAQRGIRLSSANSINWGRLCPQIVYYATSYLQLCAAGAIAYGDPVDFCVPTGNFGDIMAGYYAKQMGLPIGRLVVAANQNNVLADFIRTGEYDARRQFYKTSSPSMDILVSSNLERLLFHASGSDAAVRGWMANLAETGRYRVDTDTLAHIQAHFAAGWADEEAVAGEIRALLDGQGYLCDPHTAVGFHVLRQWRRDAARPCVVLSTASPYKFPAKVLASLGQAVPADEFQALDLLQKTSGQPVPRAIAELKDKPVRFSETIQPADIETLPLRLTLF